MNLTIQTRNLGTNLDAMHSALLDFAALDVINNQAPLPRLTALPFVFPSVFIFVFHLL